MKKLLCIVLSIVTLITLMLPCFGYIGAKLKENDITEVNKEIVRMINEHNGKHEDILEKSGAESIIVDDRLIVETSSKINTYDSVDEVYGLGYAFIQFEDAESAEKALEQYKNQGLTAQNDKLYKLSATATSSTESDWAYKYTEADTTLKYFNNNNSQVIVGIIDTGIDYYNDSMSNRIIRTNKNFSTSYIGDREYDEYGHGTNVAGVVALSTPSNVKLSAFKVADSQGHLYTSSLICAYEYILAMNENKPDIINMSYGGYEPESVIEGHLFQELKDSGISLIAAAGNENVDTRESSPANNKNVLAVSGYDENGNKCWFSNYGTTVDIAAPGTNVKTYKKASSSFEYVDGTSFSAPFVSAAAAYVIMQDNTRTPDEVYEILKSSAVKRNKASDRMWAGAGLLNFSNLIEGERKNDVTFNYESGTYNDTIKIELSCADKLNTKIIYTTDGTLPSSSNGNTYRNSITVDSQATIIAAAFPIIGSAMHSKYTINNYQIFKNADENDFEITDDGVITAYNGKYVAIKVPDTIRGIIPLQIDQGCFMYSDIVSIELPETIHRIDYDAFNGSSLEKIIGLGVTECSTRAFNDCYSLYYENMPNITKLHTDAFSNCNLINELTFSDKLEYADECFSGTGLQMADFPNLMIEERAFENTPITYANLPKITNLEGGFKDCKMLREINIPNVTKIGQYAFANCVSLPKEMDFSNITEVDYNGFAYSPFENLELPNCVKVRGGAFLEAAAKHIDLPKCEELPSRMFGGNNLEYVNIENAKTIPATTNGVFINCFSLKNIYAPNLEKIPSFCTDEEGYYELSQGTVPALEFIYAPKAIEFNYSYCNLQEFVNLKFIFAPKLESLAKNIQLPITDDLTLYFSDSLTEVNNLEDSVRGKYTVIAPENSKAEQWAKRDWYYCRGGVNFIPNDTIKYTGTSNDSFVYTSEENDVIEFPAWLVEEMWYDYLPINEAPDFTTHGYLIDVVPDGIINAKDFAVIIKSDKL